MTPLENVEVIFSLISQGISPEFDGRMTVAFLPTMNVVSGMLQDGELTHDQAIKVSFSIVFCHPLNNTLNEDWKRIYQQLVRGHHALKTLRSMHLEHVVFALPNIHAVKKQNGTIPHSNACYMYVDGLTVRVLDLEFVTGGALCSPSHTLYIIRHWL